jgi:GNAT superfamily N-acetyltransferase
VPEVVNAASAPDAVRAMARRRQFDEAGVRLALEAAERGRVWIARDDAEAVAIAVAHDSGDERYVGELFVEPSYRGQGIGTRLLQAAFEDAGDADRAMLIDASDPAAVALALAFGAAPRETVLRFAGAIPREEELAKMAAGQYRFEVGTIDAAPHAFGLDELDRQARGAARPADHRAFARDATGRAFFLNGEFVAYAYVWPDGRIGPLACASEAYLVQVFAFALVMLQRAHGASWCSALVPGSNRRIARTALRAGLKIGETNVLAGVSHANMSTYVGCHRLLL